MIRKNLLARKGRSAAVLSAGFLTAAVAAPSHAVVDNAWAATSTLHAEPNGATRLGLLPATTSLHIVVSLRLNDRAGLDQFITARSTPGNPLYRAKLSTAQFVERYSPRAAQVQLVVDYLKAYGFSNLSVSSNRTLIEADASVASINAAFDTEIAQYRLGERTEFANTRDVRVPSHLANIVLAVHGLENHANFRPMNVRADGVSTNAAAKGFLPTQFPIPYNALGWPTASNTPAGILTWGNISQTLKDLTTFESTYALVPVPTTVVYVGTPSSSDTSYVAEADLDSQNMLGMAGISNTSTGLKSLTFYGSASNSTSDLTSTLNKVVTTNIERAINGSFSGCESANYITGAIATWDQIFAQAVSQNQTFFFSSGDSGSASCSTSKPAVGYPASSPYVVAVGGTTLYSNGSYGYLSESAWSGSGGGVSQFETAPSWQQQYLGATKRLVPDFAMDADPNTGSIIIVYGRNAQYGGTSLSAPLLTGIWSRFQSIDNNVDGFAAPELYYIAKYISSPQTPIHDVTNGSNGAYTATVGFDYTTGYGSLNVGAILADLGLTQ